MTPFHLFWWHSSIRQLYEYLASKCSDGDVFLLILLVRQQFCKKATVECSKIYYLLIKYFISNSCLDLQNARYNFLMISFRILLSFMSHDQTFEINLDRLTGGWPSCRNVLKYQSRGRKLDFCITIAIRI
jgi:hypothetical protein